jgi:hypothetical protein
MPAGQPNPISERDRIVDPFWESMLDSRAPRIVRAGFPDGLSLFLAHSRLPRGAVTFRACPIVRPGACIRTFCVQTRARTAGRDDRRDDHSR